MGRSDRCDQCDRKIRFTATKAADLPGIELCSTPCVERYRRDATIFRASIDGATVEELGERFDLRREKVTQILVTQRTRRLARLDAPVGSSLTKGSDR